MSRPLIIIHPSGNPCIGLLIVLSLLLYADDYTKPLRISNCVQIDVATINNSFAVVLLV